MLVRKPVHHAFAALVDVASTSATTTRSVRRLAQSARTPGFRPYLRP
ncbi:MAG: hypothetical protein HOY78_40535 [Saccharothrix sp.]|nr:hypothetical protein [Saccharothrix sp.]